MDVKNETIDLPGGIRLELQLAPQHYRELVDYWGDILPYYAVHRSKEPPKKVLRVRNSEVLNEDGMRKFGSAVLAKQGVLLDTDLRTRIDRVDDNTIELETTASVVDWLGTIIQLLLLETAHAAVHCAGMAKDGKAILFPSWGGVGKTAITKHFVEDKGWQLLGDDLVIVDDNGLCHAYPRAMVLYPYHKNVFPKVFDAGKGPVAPAATNELLDKVARISKPFLRKSPALLRWARRNNPQSIRIAPSQVFGNDSISSPASVGAVVWLERDSSLAVPKIEPADARFASRVAGTTLNEGSRHCVNLTPTMFGLGMFDFGQTYGAWSTVLQQAFSSAECWMISLPLDMPIDEVPTAVHDLLQAVGLSNLSAVAD